MHRFTCVLALCALLAVPAVAQQAQQNEMLVQAQQVVAAAENAGAPTYAPVLMDEARARLAFAQENWTSQRSNLRDESRLRSAEAIASARAALARSRWLGTNAAIRNLQSDITRFGGRSDIGLAEEEPTLGVMRGGTSRERVAYAQSFIDQARAAGAESVPGNELDRAQSLLETARRIARGNDSRPEADHLAYLAEMIGRTAYYNARLRDAERQVPGLQMERTRLARAESERAAAAERAQREQAERNAMELRRQLEAEQANRQAATSELERLRNQVEENRRAIEQRAEADRAARIEAEQRLDTLMRSYEVAVSSAAPAELEALRRQVEDQTIALRAMQAREQQNEQQMATELESLRTQLATARQQGVSDVATREVELARREAELEKMRRDRAEVEARRVEVERQQQAAIAEAQKRREESERQAEELRRQAMLAQQAAEQSAAELEKARAQTAETQAELQRTREQLASREADTRRLALEAELARIASTRRDARGFIITLPGIFFDTGKAQLKSGSRATLTRIATQLKTDDTLQLTVEGHTDSVGSESSNETLSTARANAVRDFLISQGVPAERLTAVGRGETQPIATNNTAAGRQQNRRVEIVLAR